MARIYLDYAATTPLKPEVASAMRPFWSQKFGNPASTHLEGREALSAVDIAQREISQILNCAEHEIIFTGSGTEADNLAVKGVVLSQPTGHIITSAIEHKAVLDTCKFLETLGYRVTYIKPDRDGVVGSQKITAAIRSDTLIISLMYINNEVGSIQPIREIGKHLEKINRERRQKILLHTDAVQAANLFDLNTNHLHVDLLTLSAHKLGGSKGVGALFIKDGIQLVPQLHGGGQERGIRSSTLNVAGIVGLAAALSLAQKNREREYKRLHQFRHWLISELAKIPTVNINSRAEHCGPSYINISVQGYTSDELVMQLDRQGIATSAASACSAGSIEPSYVLKAMGLSDERASSSLRITLGYQTTKTELQTLLKVLKKLL